MDYTFDETKQYEDSWYQQNYDFLHKAPFYVTIKKKITPMIYPRNKTNNPNFKLLQIQGINDSYKSIQSRNLPALSFHKATNSLNDKSYRNLSNELIPNLFKKRSEKNKKIYIKIRNQHESGDDDKLINKEYRKEFMNFYTHNNKAFNIHRMNKLNKKYTYNIKIKKMAIFFF